MTDINLMDLSLAELKKLEKEVGKAISSYEDRQKSEARAEAEAVARKFGFSLEALVGPDAEGKKRTVSQAKYRDPANPELTWTGRGRKPSWLVIGLASCKTLEDFAI